MAAVQTTLSVVSLKNYCANRRLLMTVLATTIRPHKPWNEYSLCTAPGSCNSESQAPDERSQVVITEVLVLSGRDDTRGSW